MFVKVNEAVVKSNYRVRPGDVIVISMPEPPRDTDVKPENIPLNIVYEDDSLLIINKEAGLVVHPAYGNYTGTLINALLFHFENLPLNNGQESRPGLIHRIDKDTSGLMIIAKTEFAMILFAGLLVFNLFSECINRAPSLILGNANYVKKVVFPLEILPVVLLGSALFHLAVSFVVWVLFYAAIFGSPPATIVYLPIVLFPLVLLTLGVSWFLASVGVYLRDVSQVIGVVTTVFMFTCP